MNKAPGLRQKRLNEEKLKTSVKLFEKLQRFSAKIDEYDFRYSANARGKAHHTSVSGGN